MKRFKPTHTQSSSSSPESDTSGSPPLPPQKTTPKKTTPCLPPGLVVIDSTDDEVPVKGKGKGKSTAGPSKTIVAPEKRKHPGGDSEARLDKDNSFTQIRKRKRLSKEEIKESIDMFDEIDNDDDDPDFNL